MPGLIHDPGQGAGYQAGKNRMYMAVNHDTGGTNSYYICKEGRPGYNTGLCQILLPKVGVPWQFTEIDAVCYHAGSAQYGDYNPSGPGLEVERLQGEDLSPDQVYWLREIFAWMEGEWGFPNVHYWGGLFPAWQADFHGWVNHSQIHPNPDGLSQAEWALIHAGSPVTPAHMPLEVLNMVTLMFAKNGVDIWRIGERRRKVSLPEWNNLKFQWKLATGQDLKPFGYDETIWNTVPE